MADPKYAGLPGIVYDQPDVFETCDLPECEQDYNAPDASESIETLHIAASDAHAMFKGKVLDASRVDFSDRVSKGNRTGYLARRIEWEIAGDGEEETLVQRYQRLQCESNQLLQDIQKVKGEVPCGDGSVSAVELSQQVESLHCTLINLKLEDQLGTDVVASIAEPQVALQKKLVNLLESFKKTGLVNSKDDKSMTESAGGSVGIPGGITYELFYAPEQAKLNNLSQAANIEKRIDYLETLLGNDPNKMSSLSTWTNHRSLVGAVQVLSCRLALLEPIHLDHVEGRLHAVHTRMNSIAEKKTVIEDADKQSKVSELYELMKKSEVLCSSLPEIVDRLVSLEALHSEAMQFSHSLKQLDVAQTQLSCVLQNNSQLLNSVQDKFSNNLEIIQNNILGLDKRVQQLQK